jgi:hypothetical protein
LDISASSVSFSDRHCSYSAAPATVPVCYIGKHYYYDANREKKKCSVQKETNKYFLYLIIFNKFYFNIILKKKKCPPLINILAPPLVAYKGCKGMPLQYAFNKVYTAKIREKILLYGLWRYLPMNHMWMRNKRTFDGK